MSRALPSTLLIAGLAVGAVSCGSDSAPAVEENAVVETTTTSTAPTVPDFPIAAAPDPGQVEVVDQTQMQVQYDEADFERVVAFYDEWTSAQESGFERFEGDDGSVGWKNDVDRGAGFRAISVAVFGLSDGSERATIATLLAD